MWFELVHTEEHASIYVWFSKIRRDFTVDVMLKRWIVNRGKMKAGVTLKMSIRWPGQWKPFTALWDLQIKQSTRWFRQTLSSWWVAVSTAFTLNYTECFGESQDGIPLPVLSVKGLISCSWSEERNCFYVCTSVYVVFAMMSHDAGSH